MSTPFPTRKMSDDYDWPSYTEIYARQTADMQGEKTDFLVKDSYVNSDGHIVFKDNLHQNWKELYKQAIERNVSEVFECGAGPGYHLHNIRKLSKEEINVYGVELLQTQIDFGKNVMGVDPSIENCVELVDFSIPCASCLFNYKYEFVYTQAVTMHLSHHKAVEFIRNMANISSKYVFLMENWNNHDYPQLLRESGVLNAFTYEIVDGEFQKYLLLSK